jgi:aminopeptidase N
MRRALFAVTLAVAAASQAAAQQPRRGFTHADTLRAANGPGRSWWDATFYDLHTYVSPADSSIHGWNGITYMVLAPAQEMQIDLQMPLEMDSIVQDGKTLTSRRDGNAFFVTLTSPQRKGTTRTVTAYYHGKPVAARRPPWDGGFIWQHDSLNRLWVATANEGLGASVWWPNKDIASDEPDSQRIAITVPDPMQDVSNGRLRNTHKNSDGTTTYEWFVTEPINNYDVEVNAGGYAHFSDVFKGESGNLTLDFWPLSYHLDTARVQFQQAKSMLSCFEHWFGPYPWYPDGYKLIEAPHLGMEHQSGVAYGNKYKNGYSGRDLSKTGIGLKWDFIIVHESAHEWWGNNITGNASSDMWIHESFANYAENLYTECQQGKDAGAMYVIGTRSLVRNDSPIIPDSGMHVEGSGDVYYKGGNMLHTIRQIVDNDEKWRDVLRGLQKHFWHQTVSTRPFEEEFNKLAGKNFDKVFDQYLTTTKLPTLEYRIDGGKLSYRWVDVVPGFDMPVRVTLNGNGYSWIHPTPDWKDAPIALPSGTPFAIDENFYVKSHDVGSGTGTH